MCKEMRLKHVSMLVEGTFIFIWIISCDKRELATNMSSPLATHPEYESLLGGGCLFVDAF